MESFRRAICKPIIGPVLLARQISSMCVINYDRARTISVIWRAYDLSSSLLNVDRDSDSSVTVSFARRRVYFGRADVSPKRRKSVYVCI